MNTTYQYHRCLWGLDDAATAAVVSGMASTASAGIQAATAGKTNARGSRLAHRQHEWAVQDAKMQRQWALDDWNRNNEYNSPSAIIERYKAAGLNPMAAVNGGNLTEAAQMPSLGSGVASPSLPSFVNAGAGIGQAIEAAGSSFMQYQDLLLRQQAMKNDTRRADAEAEYKAALTTTEDQIRNGKLEFLGVQIDLGKSQRDLTDAQRKTEAQKVLNLKQDVETAKQYAVTLGIQARWSAFQLYAAKKKLPLEIKQAAAAILFQEQQTKSLRELTYGQNLQNRKDYTYFKTGRWWKDTKNQSDMLEEYRKQSQNATLSPQSAAVQRGMSVVSSILAPAVQAVQGYYIFERAKQIRGSMRMPSSSPNQPVQDLMTPQGNIEFGF